MSWDEQYRASERIWGEGPSVLAVAAQEYLQSYKSSYKSAGILDIGCGYGRDALYMLDHFTCLVHGIDTSEKAIQIASETAARSGKRGATFELRSFKELGRDKYDIVFVSNFYQLLEKGDRSDLRERIKGALRPGGFLFLSTLSVNDPEPFGKGAPVPGEPNSFRDKYYLHLCTEEELRNDFSFLHIEELCERNYDEPRATGETHHHISWILIAKSRTGDK